MNYKRGIDVSYAQGTIDWDELAASGKVDFVMIRAGYGQNNIDKQWKANADACTRLGIPFGVYWFSYARSEEYARKEARYCIEAVKPYTLSYPIAFDFEYDSVDYLGAQGINVSQAFASAVARAFLEEIESAGYYPMLYTNRDYLNRYFDLSLISKYDIWLAQWPVSTPNLDNPPLAVRNGIWQYANDGVVSGITQNVVDLDACYTDYPSIISDMEVNKVKYHTREDIEKDAPYALETFDKLVKNEVLKGVAPNDYSISDDMLRVLVILDRAGAFDGLSK